MQSVQAFDRDNVLFSKLRPYLNKVVIPDECGYATTELVPLKPNKDKLNKIYFSFLLKSDKFVKWANDIATGTKMPRMPLGELRNFNCNAYLHLNFKSCLQPSFNRPTNQNMSIVEQFIK